MPFIPPPRLKGVVLTHDRSKCRAPFYVYMGSEPEMEELANPRCVTAPATQAVLMTWFKQNQYDCVEMIKTRQKRASINEHMDGAKACHRPVKDSISTMVPILRRKPRDMTEEDYDKLHMQEPKQPWDRVAKRMFRRNRPVRVRKSRK